MNIFKNIPISRKLVIIQAVTATAALVICCSIFVAIGISVFRSSAEKKMLSIARIVGANSVSALIFMDSEADSVILHKLQQETDIIDAIVLDRRGKVFASYYRHGAAR